MEKGVKDATLAYYTDYSFIIDILRLGARRENR